MKLLFDQNLSHKLPARLADLFPGSVHVRTAGLDRADDDAIWHHARAGDFAIVTQDADFAERSHLFGSPPKVIWLRCGNTTPAVIEQLLRRNQIAISEMAGNPAVHFVEVF